jgi:hypothetical protein
MREEEDVSKEVDGGILKLQMSSSVNKTSYKL